MAETEKQIKTISVAVAPSRQKLSVQPKLKHNNVCLIKYNCSTTFWDANHLKTPAKVSWAFKMVSQFGSLGYTIMGKTADLTVVQKTIIDTLHKEGKPQTFIAKEAVCSQSAVSKHVNRELSRRQKCGRKRCTTNRENHSLMRIVKQNRFKNLGELHKEWTEAGVEASRATTHRRVKEFGYSCLKRLITWAKEKNWTVAQWSKVLFSDESKVCISFGIQGLRVWMKGGEARSQSCLKFSVKFPQSVMIWGAMSSAGVGPLRFLKTSVTAPIYQEILEHFMLPSADQLFKDADFIFQQDLAPVHTAKSTKSWLNDHGVGVLDWSPNSPDLNPRENRFFIGLKYSNLLR